MRRIVIGFALLMLSSCGVGGTPVETDGRNVGAVTLTFRVEPARVRVGQPVSLRLRLVNNAGQATELTFPSGQRYDYWVTSEDGDEVWRWSEGKFFTQAITTETIRAQGSLSFPEPWTPDAAGTFVAHGELTAQGYAGELTGRVVVE